MSGLSVSNGWEAKTVVLVHGGAGDVPEARREAHALGCLEAARAGYAIIAAGGAALDAVQAAVRVLEDLPQFNAGTGAALNERGNVEHDAAIMSGEDLRAGAVCALSGFKNPIDVARAALNEARHVLYAAEGAAELALLAGIASVDPSTLVTDLARASLERVLRARKSGEEASTGWAGGTVGAVARDSRGSLAAATSTGGIIGKRHGRVGDSPILGAGTYADSSCAVSATGDGEAILRFGLAHRICSSVRASVNVEDAAREHVNALARDLLGKGGVILVDKSGRFGFARTTTTMSYAWVSESGQEHGT